MPEVDDGGRDEKGGYRGIQGSDGGWTENSKLSKEKREAVGP